MTFPMEAEAEKSMAAVALAVAGSRVAGLLRDMLIFALLGLSAWNEIFLFAFTVPNLFRRLLGEGALASAFIPLFSETLVRDDRDRAYDFLNRVLTRLIATISLLLGTFAALYLLARPFLTAHWDRALGFTLLLSPYLLPACLSAMLCGALNSVGIFGLPAATAICLNCCMLLAGGGALFLPPGGGRGPTLCLCLGILIGGIFQLLLPWSLLRRRGWRFHWRWAASPLLSRLWPLFLPALFGAAVVQINATVSRLLAFWLTDGGIATLYLSSRLVELPLGIFAIAITSVSFPEFSRLASRGDGAAFAASYRSACRSAAMVAFPALLGLLLLARPILTVLFQWGHYGAADLQRTIPVLAVSALGIPFHALSAIAVRAFHARQKMGTPLRTAAISAGANILLTVIFANVWGAVGIAAAGVAAAALQWALLTLHLVRRFGMGLGGHYPQLALANALLALVLTLLVLLPIPVPDRPAACIRLAIALPLGFFGYIAVLRRLHFPEISLFSAILRPFSRR